MNLLAVLERIFLLLLALLTCLLLSSCRPSTTEIRLAMNPWPAYEFLYLAKAKGFFAEENLPVRLVEYSSLSDSRVALESGQVDAVVCTLVEVLLARDHTHRAPDIALVVDYSDGADVILARTNVPTLAALKGKKVGLESGTLGVFMLAKALGHGGLELKDVLMQPCLPDRMLDELKAGTLDAVVTYPPTSVSVEASGVARRLFSSKEIPGEVVDVVAVEASVLERNPELPARLARVFQRALDYSRAHPQEAHEFMARREGLSAQEFAKALEGIRLVDAAGQRAFLGSTGSLERTLRQVERVLIQTGQVREQPSANAPHAAGSTNSTNQH